MRKILTAIIILQTIKKVKRINCRKHDFRDIIFLATRKTE